MFNKKLFFKFAGIITSFTILICFILTAFSFISDTAFYHRQMCKDLTAVAESDLTSSVAYVLSSDSDDNTKASAIDNILKSFNGQLGVNENRTAYILDPLNASVVAPASQRGQILPQTDNITAVQTGTSNQGFGIFSDSLDSAHMIRAGESQFILYLKDNKADIRGENFYKIKFLLYSLLLGIILSLFISLLLERRISLSVNKITDRAEGFKKGELYGRGAELKENDFPKLVDAVNSMGFVMTESISRMNADKHRVEVILEHINNGIITFDSNQNIIQMNSASRRILKIKDNETAKFDEFFSSYGLDIKMLEFVYLEKSGIVEKEIIKEGGHIKVWFIPFKMDGNLNAGVVCVFEDVTEQFNVMSAMRKFVADVSHELKTPITVISTYTETVLNSYIDDKAMTANLLNIVYQETVKMNELVQNLLDISRYEMKTMPRKEEEFSIDEMLGALVKTFKLQTEQKDLELTYTRMGSIPDFIGSRSDIERAVKNIISNSIKYTSKGDKIRIYAGSLHNDIYIKIEDTGWGIPENKLGHIFERFYRVEEEARSRDKGGTGLGLSITKEIIESYGGNIKIESEYTKYTRVTITLPIPKK